MTPTPSISSRFSRRPGLTLVAGVAAAVIAAGCGAHSPSSASVTGAAAAAAKGGPGEAAFRFSACMRNHGVSNFPDPKVKTSGGGTSVAIAINPSISGQPAFKSAQKACQHILPKPGSGSGPDRNSPAKVQAMIAFARCLRTHGFPNFPDPNANGDLSEQTIARAGINLQTPALLTAAQRCTSVTHGIITPAQVAQAINHARTEGTQQANGG
jgi:hypothetical protein